MIAVLLVQKGLAVRHHATAGRVLHPGIIDGRYGNRTAASLRSWYRATGGAARWGNATGPDPLLDDLVFRNDAGHVTFIHLDSTAEALLNTAAGSYVASRHRWLIVATVLDPEPLGPEPSGPWPYTPGSLDLDPELEPPDPVVDVGPLPDAQQPSPRLLPTGPSPLPVLRPRQQEAPMWPWVVGGIAVLAVVGVVVWKSSKSQSR